MTQKKKIVFALLGIVLIMISVGVYLWYKPHRDVQATTAFAQVKVSELTAEFALDAAKANAKYLSADGNSKVLIVEGKISSISINQAGEKVIVLKDDKSRVGISATFSIKNTDSLKDLKIGDIIKIKGAITAGNTYDSNLDLYENAVLVQCDIVK